MYEVFGDSAKADLVRVVCHTVGLHHDALCDNKDDADSDYHDKDIDDDDEESAEGCLSHSRTSSRCTLFVTKMTTML